MVLPSLMYRPRSGWTRTRRTVMRTTTRMTSRVMDRMGLAVLRVGGGGPLRRTRGDAIRSMRTLSRCLVGRRRRIMRMRCRCFRGCFIVRGRVLTSRWGWSFESRFLMFQSFSEPFLFHSSFLCFHSFLVLIFRFLVSSCGSYLPYPLLSSTISLSLAVSQPLLYF
ncbi:hypothetical protein DFP72DRAFT_936000 [Ephemerocybe angulata]|uniref:Uncharacterized protein n=1 Tax=Ephemerocybe angulata TaxID=980116 RepID=A0A8H6H972_9AGAR|nr:hypothetical protein DFP72DRAFT_936000 [Tulosesus angulatus]